jgi:TRAP-type C4-dicarboxylate transport system substrate-binding protein
MHQLIRVLAALVLCAANTAFAQQPVVLKFASFEPPAAYLTSKVFVPWAEDVTKSSGGALKVDVFAGGTLGRNPAQQFKLVQDGVADIAWVVAGYTPGRFDDADVVTLPFLTANATEASVALWRLYSRGALRGFDDLKLLAIGATPPVVIHSRAPVRNVADLKGKRVRATGEHLTKVVEALGGTPVQLGGPQIPEALSRGLVDMTLNNWGFVGDFKGDEVTSHHLTMQMGAVVVMVPMLKSRYDGLPAAAKAAIDKYSGEAFSRRLGEGFDAVEKLHFERISKSGRNTVAAPTAADIEAWKQVVEPVNESWRKAKPQNAGIYKAFVDELAKVRAGN